MTICEHKKYNINPKGKEKRISLLSSYSLDNFGHLVLGNLQTLSHECTCLRATVEPLGATAITRCIGVKPKSLSKQQYL